MIGGFPTFRGLGLPALEEARLTAELRGSCIRLAICPASLEAVDIVMALYREWLANGAAMDRTRCA